MSLGSQPVSNFYGPQCQPRVRQLEKLASTAKRSVVPYILKDLLNGPSLQWKIFKKQEDALNFSKSAKGGLMTFAFEPQDQNGRLFLSAHPQVFWHYDEQRPDNERSTYEIITENAVCKLYADLEFDRMANPSADGSKLVEIFIEIVRSGLRRLWNVDCPIERIINLDSSNSSKFSRHLIFQVNFYNNYHVGAFLKHLLSPNFDNDMLKKLSVHDSKGGEKSFCDLSVYSKNRHFRLFRSTKKGKNSPFLVSSDNKFPVTTDLDTFLSSLITNTTENSRVLEWKSEIKSAVGQLGKILSHTPDIHSSDNLPPTTSPYPVINAFIDKIVAPGKIHSSAYFPSSRVIVFSIVGNRFCGNINRQHKSNNVKFVVDLDRYEYYQKCYDFDCRNYRSEPKSLPSEVIFQMEECSGLFEENVACSLGNFDLSNEETVSTNISQTVTSCQSATGASLQKFPSFGLADDAFENLEF